MSAVRVARGFTGRSRIVKFAGCYHGHSDALLAGGGSGVATLGLPGLGRRARRRGGRHGGGPLQPGPRARRAGGLRHRRAGGRQHGTGAARPAGFLEGLRAACDAVGALLIFDEVITGFRLGEGGASGWSGVRPDLWCFGKVIGGGLPVGAFGGRADVLVVAGPGRPGVPGRAPCRGIRWPPRPVWPSSRRWTRAPTPRSRTGWPGSGRRSRRCCRPRLAKAGTTDADGRQLEAAVPVVGPLFGLFFVPAGLGSGPRLRRCRRFGRDRPVHRGCSARCWSAGWPSPRALRGGLPVDGPRRGRARAHARRRRRSHRRRGRRLSRSAWRARSPTARPALAGGPTPPWCRRSQLGETGSGTQHGDDVDRP